MPSQLERRPDLDSLFSVNPDGSRNTIHPAPVRGRFQRGKNALWLVLIAVYLALPWLEVGGQPAILIDIERRNFYLFGSTFNAQDFWLAFFFVTGIGFALIVVSALWGRLWCGYACPQTVFLEGVYRRVEGWIDGTPRQRRERERAPWTGGKIARRLAKWSIFLAISLALAHTGLGYFMPVRDVLAAMTGSPREHFTAFGFVVVLTAIVFVNFTWFREQLCIVVCPYGRLQGVLYDQHTVNVAYDAKRGEPRGKTTASGHGDCVDCFRCVQVCPTGIDIRNGVQLECVGCANCVDACDEVMGKLGRPAGLVRYDSLAGLAGEPRRFWRPRVFLYGALLVIGVAVFAIAAGSRTPFEANLLRSSSPVAIAGDLLTNTFVLHLVNKQPRDDRFALTAVGPPGFEVVLPMAAVDLASLRDLRVPITVRGPVRDYRPDLALTLQVRGESATRELRQTLLGPLTGGLR